MKESVLRNAMATIHLVKVIGSATGGEPTFGLGPVVTFVLNP